jgi:hypothetical protein
MRQKTRGGKLPRLHDLHADAPENLGSQAADQVLLALDVSGSAATEHPALRGDRVDEEHGRAVPRRGHRRKRAAFRRSLDDHVGAH